MNKILVIIVWINLRVFICIQSNRDLNEFIHTGTDASDISDLWKLCSLALPRDTRFWPTVGNGHLATVVHSNTVYMNGLYNGRSRESHRARIPAMTSLNITNISESYTNLSYCLEMNTGMYVEYYTGEHWNVTLKVYAHRNLTRLLVTELIVKADDRQMPFTITLGVNHGNDSDDIYLRQGNTTIPDAIYMYGSTKMSETSNTNTTPVHVYFTQVPQSIQVKSGFSSTFLFLMSVSPFQVEAETFYRNGFQLFHQNSLQTWHVRCWYSLWGAGRIDVFGNDDLAAAILSALYYILSSMPTIQEQSWPFVGLSPGDLAHDNNNSYLYPYSEVIFKNKTQAYNGHVFWDQDTWMFPPVLMLYHNLAKNLVNTRIRTLDPAYANAKQQGLQGAMYPWESALEGFETSPSMECGKYEIHISGDVSLMFWQYLLLTRDIDIVINGRVKEAAFAIADYWKSRVIYNVTTHLYEIKDVMPPDEWHYPVNNSAYTNAVAIKSLLLPKYVCELLNETAPIEYETIASQMYIPFENASRYHPEYDGFQTNISVKQADVILLGFPLMMDMPTDVRHNDLDIYEKLTPGGPAMTWSMFFIGWQEVDETQKAEEAFLKQLENKRDPFNIWTENADGGGVTNFITGQGGYLQSILFGFGGLRITTQGILVNCKPLPNSSSLRIKGLDFLNNSIDIWCDFNTTTITLIQDYTPIYSVVIRTREIFLLKKDIPISVSRQELLIQSNDFIASSASDLFMWWTKLLGLFITVWCINFNQYF